MSLDFDLRISSNNSRGLASVTAAFLISGAISIPVASIVPGTAVSESTTVPTVLTSKPAFRCSRERLIGIGYLTLASSIIIVSTIAAVIIAITPARAVATSWLLIIVVIVVIVSCKTGKSLLPLSKAIVPVTMHRPVLKGHNHLRMHAVSKVA